MPTTAFGDPAVTAPPGTNTTVFGDPAVVEQEAAPAPAPEPAAPARVVEQPQAQFEAIMNRRFQEVSAPATGVEFDEEEQRARDFFEPVGGALGSIETGILRAQRIAPLIFGKEASRLKTGQGMDPPEAIKRQAIEDIYGETFQAHVDRLEGAQDPERRADLLYDAYQQRVHDLTQKRNAMLDVWSGVAADLTKEEGEIPKSKAQKELAGARTQKQKWAVFRKYPLQVTSSVVLESLPPGLAGAFVGGAVGGPPGMVGGVTLSSFAQEYSGSLLEGAGQLGYDVSEPTHLAAFLDSPEYDKVSDKAMVRAGIVATFDAATAGTTSMWLKPAVKEGLKATLIAGGKSTGVEMLGGFSGEFAAQAATKKKGEAFDLFEMSMEAAGEGVSTTYEGGITIGSELNRLAPATGVAAERAAALGKVKAALAKARPTQFGDPPAPQHLQQAEEELRAALSELQSLPREESPAISATEGAEAGAPASAAAPDTTTVFAPARVPTHSLPIDQIKLSRDVQQFKAGADPDTGEVVGEELRGKWDPLGPPITVWERNDGTLEVITGRHRLAKARRAGETHIDAQVVKEAEGFTAAHALTFDAEANIRDGQGTVRDYAHYFRNSREQLTKEEAEQRGLLSRAKGQAGFDLGHHASDDLYSLYAAGRIAETQALAITRAAPGNPEAQRIGIKFAGEGRPADFIGNLVKAAVASTGGQAESLDLFGRNDTALNQAEEQATRAAAAQRQIREQIQAVSGAVKRPDVARSLGVDVKDPGQVAAKLAELRAEAERWENWPMHPDLVARTRGATTGQTVAGEPPAMHETPTPKMDEKERADQKFLISESQPSAVGSPDPLKVNIQANRANRVAQPGATTMLGLIMRHYPNLRAMKGTGQQVLDAFHAHIVDNLLWLYHVMPPEMRRRAQDWYEGANKLVRRWSVQYGRPRQAVAAVMAALSPGTDWFINVEMARRVLEFWRDGKRRTVDDKMLEWVGRQLAKQATKVSFDKVSLWQKNLVQWKRKGTKFGKLASREQALFLRAWDESRNPAHFFEVYPDGTFAKQPAKNDDGTLARINWQSLDNIEKALSVLRTPTKRNISRRMGWEHKVRSFYNNLLSPSNASALTSDTHAVAAALLRPLGGKSLEVNHNFGRSPEGSGYRGSGGYAFTGASGIYGLVADGYRDAANRLDLLPRQLQSAVWEAANRWLFPAGYKNTNQADLIEAAWQRYKRGEISLKQVRRETLKHTIGHRLGPRALEAALARAERFEELQLRRDALRVGGPANARGVSGPDLHGGRAGTAARGTGSAAPATLAETVTIDGTEQTTGQNPRLLERARRKAKAAAQGLVQLQLDLWSARGGNRVGRAATTVSGALRIFVNSLKEDLDTSQGVEVTGQPANTPAEVALLAQVFRNPKFETTHYLFTKGGVVVGRYATSARIPHTTYLWAHGDTLASVQAVGKALGADAYWMLHNHPSGDPTPGPADQNGTRKMAQEMPGFKGHIVINHGEYGYVDQFGYAVVRPLVPGAVVGPDPLRKTAAELGPFAWMLGRQIYGAPDVAWLHSQMAAHVRQGTVSIILVDPKGRARALGDIGVADFMNQAVLLDQLRKTAAAHGGAYAFAYYEGTDPAVVARAQAYVQDDVFTDIVLGATGGIGTTGYNMQKWIGQPLGGAARVAEEPGDVRIAQARAAVKEAWQAFYSMGIAPNPEEDARKVFNFYKAVFNLARAYVAKGIRSAADFASAAGIELNAIVQRAWDDAVAGKPKGSPNELPADEVGAVAGEMRERKFSTRFDADPRMEPEVRAATGNRTYLPIGNELTAVQAHAFIQEHGIDAAIARMKDERNRDISDRERVTIGQAIVQKLNHEYATTKSDAALDKAVDVAEWLTEYGTRLGQGVQAFAIWNSLTPDGFVRTYVTAVNRADRTRAARRPVFGPAPVPRGADPETKKRIHAMATEALRKPAGFQRDAALVDVLAEIERAKGLNRWDMVIALWYANLLSGWTTQVRNIVGNLGNILAETGAHAVVRPMSIPAMIAGIFNGAARGAFDAANILRTGKITGTRVGKVEAPRSLEMIKFRGPFYILNAWKYVFRVMAATDMVFFRSAEEMKARFLGRQIAKLEGLKGDAFKARLAALLRNTTDDRQRAEVQAAAEGLTGNAARRRVGELMEQARPEALVQAAAEYGRFATFNQEPAGVLGMFANAIREMSGKFAPLRLLVPFTSIVANVTNSGLNFTPWGYRRLFPSVFLETNWMSDTATPLDYQLQAARATLGTLGLTALYAMAQAWAGDDEDDEEPPFAITANGPQDPGQRSQLRETGWKPYTVKIGRNFISYRETPLHLGLAYIGSIMDAHRYKHLGEQDTLSRAAYGLRQIGTALLNQSFLKSLGEFFESLGNDQVPRAGPKIGGLQRMVSSAVPNLVKQVDRLFDPTIYDGQTIQGAMMRDLPVARQYLKPSVNVLGETIRADLNPFYSVERPDELWTTLAGKQAWVSTPERTTMVGDRLITPEEYYEWVVESGPAIRTRLEMLLTAIQISTRERAQDLVREVVQEERALARRRLGIAH